MTNRIAHRDAKSRSSSVRTKMDKAPRYEFDAALSFAGEDREHAARLAKALKARGCRVFYDKDFRGELWGKWQKKYEQIYCPKSRFVIPFVHSREWAWVAPMDGPGFSTESCHCNGLVTVLELSREIQGNWAACRTKNIDFHCSGKCSDSISKRVATVHKRVAAAFSLRCLYRTVP
jgi:hypothetical protein